MAGFHRARLGRGTAAGAAFWIGFGISAASGPALLGRLADRIGARRTYLIALALQAVALAAPLVGTTLPLLALSTVLAAATSIGLTGLTLTRARELAGEAAAGVWRVATACWGATQTAAGFALSAVLAATGTHRTLFAFGLAAALAALAVAASEKKAVRDDAHRHQGAARVNR